MLNGNILLVEDIKLETTETPVPVYNFQVEDFHTYHVGENGIWVHNADYGKGNVKEHLEGTGSKEGIKPNGRVNGTHNKDNFMSELNKGGGKIESVTPFKGIDGVEEIVYRPFNKKTGEFKNTTATKTVYDPSKISSDAFIERGMEAVKNADQFPEGVYKGYGYDNSGVKWEIIIDADGQNVKTMYPVSE